MCVLRVSGRRFDPARFLTDSKLEACSVFRVGEPRLKSRPHEAVHDKSGFNVEVSDSSWDGLPGQVADAIAFLRKHRRSLAKLSSMPDVEDITLDFPLDLRIDRKNVFTQFDHFPAELVSLAGALGLGLELSIYPRDLEQLARSRRRPSPRRAAGPRKSALKRV